ncbi:MAG: GtrA family protein [Oscillospiraceae bacterium]|nr:GtrA family protein [Oscillospiraceae bacterium]
MLEKLLLFVVKLLPKPLKNLWEKYEHALRYCYYGGWTTVLSMLTKFIGKWLFLLGGMSVDTQKIPNSINTAVSWIICATFAFIVNKKYVFHSESTERSVVLREFSTFFSARGFTFFLEWGLMLLPTIFGWSYNLMVILSQFIIFALNYIFSRLLVFRKKAETPEQTETEQS